MILLLSYVGIAAIGVAYGAIFFVLIAFMVSGDGNNEQVFAWWRTGLSIIAGCCVVGAIVSTVKRPIYGVVCALMGGPAVGVYLFGLFSMEEARMQAELETPLPAALQAQCVQAGPIYLASPTAPVRSIAYDWPEDSTPSSATFVVFNEQGHMRRRGRYSPLPKALEFVESRCCRGDPRARGTGMYRRRYNGSSYEEEISELSADVLVFIESAMVEPRSKEHSGVIATKVAVTDRRDGRLLATLRHAHDSDVKRICGATSPGTLDELAFVLRAAGIAP